MSPEDAVLINEEACFSGFGNLAITDKESVKGAADSSLLLGQNLRHTIQGIYIAAGPALVLFGDHIHTLSTLFSQCLAVNRYSKHG